MIRWSKVRAVASFEFLSTVKRKGYLIATFGMPVFMLLYGALISLPGYFAARGGEDDLRVYAVVDEADVLQLRSQVEVPVIDLPEEARAALEMAGSGNQLGQVLREGGSIFTPFPDFDRARAAASQGEVRGIYLLPADYLETGRVEVYRRDTGLTGAAMSGDQFRRLLRDRLLAGRVSPEIAERLKRTITQSEQFLLTEEDTVEPWSIAGLITRFAVPAAFAMLLFVSLMMTSGYLLQATATEKENKVVEVLLSAANPDEILFGKLVGLGAAGLLQVLVWTSMVIAAGLVAAGVLTAVGVEVPWTMMAIGVPFFIATYLFVGSLILASASLGGNLKESQQWSLIWTLLMVVPFFFIAPLIEEPNGTIAQVLSWIPFSAALTLLLRLTLEPEGVAWWQIVGSFAVLLGSTWIAIRLGARLFRVGLLLTGSRSGFREILRQARLSDR